MRRRPYLVAAGLALWLAGTVAAQQPPVEKDREEKPIVVIGTTLVQVDAIVTDKNGRPVTDLTRDDFQVLQDDQPQDITAFVYVPTHPVPPPPATDGPAPPVRAASERVRRTIAIVIDDLKSSESARVTREAVRRFVDERMEPGDLVAIVQARAGAGALQQFSGNRQDLYAAIERIRYVPRSHNEGDCEEGADAGKVGERDLNEALRTDIFVRGTLGVLNFVVRGLKELPGRKAVVLLSDGMSCALEDTDPRGPSSNRVRSAILNLVDLANRGSVAIYSVDVRGVEPLAVPASDGQPRPRLSDLADLVGKERSKLFHSRDVMSFLASQTGGLFFFNNNDIAEGIRRAVDDQGGYYLLAYEPDSETFAPKNGGRDFHKLSVRVKREGLTVRSRTGFYGYSDEQKMPETRSRAQQMVDAVISPFAASGVRMQLTPLFADDPKAGLVVKCLLHVDARDLTFEEDRDGWRKAVVDVALVAFGDNGGMVSRQADTHEIRIRGDAYDLALERGLIQIVTLPLKRAGAYQVRAAVRDAASERIGSAYQFVELPDVADGEFALSSIVVSSDAAPVDQRALDRRQTAAPELPVSPAVRRFHRGDRVAYAFEIYNAARDRATKRTALEISTHIYREGRLVHMSEPTPLDPGAQADWSHIRIGRGLLIGTEMEPGSYVLEITLTDLANKRHTASQWVDFEIE
jgi:VWFA-related protein